MIRSIGPLVVLVGVSSLLAAPRLKELPPANFYPTTVGDRWTMETRYSAGHTETITEVVTQVEKIEGGTLVTVRREANGKIQEPKAEMKVTEAGLFRVSHYGTSYKAPYQVLKLPLKIGSEWTAEVDTGAAAIFKYKVTKVEDIEVPAGKYKTFKLEVDLGDQGKTKSVIWYAPRVGVVQHEYISENINYMKVLTEFKQGK